MGPGGTLRAAVQERFPDAARAVDPDVSAPVAPQHGWVPLPGGRDALTEGRVFDDRISAMIAPGPGGRWETWVGTDGKLTQGGLCRPPMTLASWPTQWPVAP